MDFSFTEEQQMLRDGVGKFLEKSYDFDARQAVVRSEHAWSKEAWDQYAEFGLLALPFAEDHGGLGGTVSDCVAIAELLGKHLTVEPFCASIIASGAALAASDSEAAQSWLEKVMSGEAVAALAYEERSGTATPEHISMIAAPDGAGFSLSGEKRLVIAGAEADVLVVVARKGEDGPLALFLVEQGTAGLSSRAYSTVDGKSAANIRFDKVQARLLAEGGHVDQIVNQAIIVQSAEAVGAMGALMAITGEYAMTRKQFGKPIGMFQAVAHRLADMKIAYTKARSTLIYTTALAESAAATTRDISILKGQIGKLGKDIGEAAIQTHEAVASDIMVRGSRLTVAGTAPDLHWLPS